MKVIIKVIVWKKFNVIKFKNINRNYFKNRYIYIFLFNLNHS